MDFKPVALCTRFRTQDRAQREKLLGRYQSAPLFLDDWRAKPMRLRRKINLKRRQLIRRPNFHDLIVLPDLVTPAGIVEQVGFPGRGFQFEVQFLWRHHRHGRHDTLNRYRLSLRTDSGRQSSRRHRQTGHLRCGTWRCAVGMGLGTDSRWQTCRTFMGMSAPGLRLRAWRLGPNPGAGVTRVRRWGEMLWRTRRESNEGVVHGLDQRDLASAQIHNVNGVGEIRRGHLNPHQVGAHRVEQFGSRPGPPACSPNAALEIGSNRSAGEPTNQQRQQPNFRFSRTESFRRRQR